MERRTRLAQWLVFVAVGSFMFAKPALAQNEGGSAPVDPAVLAEFDVRGEATFFVLFQEKADLSPAYEIRDWGERGWFVYRRLLETAESSQARVRALLDEWGAKSRPFWIVNAIEVSTQHRALVSVLAARPEVAEVVAPPLVEPIDFVPAAESPPVEAPEWNIENIRAPEVWNSYNTRGEGIVIGYIDWGVQYDHPALVNQYRGNLGGGVFDHNYNWYDLENACGNPSEVPCDLTGHGTATTGLAVGDDGGSNQIGVAPGARFMMAAIDSIFTVGVDAMEWMLAPTDINGENPRPDLRPHVVNCSWGNVGGNNNIWRAAVQAWLDAGIFPVFVIGNEGPNCGTGRSPGDYEETYAVGAYDVDNNIWESSSRGPSDFGPIKPDITAPGVSVRTSVPEDLFPSLYEYGTATSFASPHVAGTVALMWSLTPELISDVETTRRHLDHAAIDVDDLSCGGESGNNNVWGEGRLDAFAAASFTLIDDFESGDTSSWSSSVP
jgi:subtilisin family serine protease